MYRDTVLGPCIDIRGPDGNVFALLGMALDLARQLEIEEEWQEAVKAAQLMGGNYMTILNLFQEYFPVVTLVGYDEIAERHRDVEETEE